jgi:hypothetical protein
MKIDYGPGYRLYFTKRAKVIVLLLCGGTKGTQERESRGDQDGNGIGLMLRETVSLGRADVV